LADKASSQPLNIAMHQFQWASAVLCRPRVFVGVSLVLTVCILASNDTRSQIRSTTPANVLSVSENQLASSSESRPPSSTSLQPEALQSLTAQSVAKGDAKHMFDAERFAKMQGCGQPTAKMVLRWPPAEMFTVDCREMGTMLVKCERNGCLEMR
jgi:hypothetical protein